MIKKLFTILFCFVSIFLYAQDCSDTLSCYAEYTYPSGFDIGIEKIWESEIVLGSFASPLISSIQCDTPSIHFGNGGYEIKSYNSTNYKALFSFTTSIFYPNPIGFYVGDFENDRSEDFILASRKLLLDGSPKRLYRYNDKGNLIWESEEIYDTSNLGNPEIYCVDLNGDGVSEIIVYGKIFNSENGKLLCKIDDNIYGTYHSCSVAGDFDEDNFIEIASGYIVYEVQINNLEGTENNTVLSKRIEIEGELVDGYTAMGDINLDGKMEIIVSVPDASSSIKLYVYSVEESKLELIALKDFKVDLTAEIGPPIVINQPLEQPSIIVSSKNYLSSYSYNNSMELKENWNFFIDEKYGQVRPTAYDLNNNGYKEIIIRDEKSLKILDLSSGIPTLTNSIPCKATTGIENPIIADIDNDGDADICVICENDGFSRLTVFSSPDTLPGWTPSRSIWNQYNYHPLYINDDMTIPKHMENPATYQNGRYNNFGVQATLLDENGMHKTAAASLYADIDCIHYNVASESYTVDYQVYNRPDASKASADSLYVSFYDGDPESSGNLLNTSIILGAIEVGDVLSGSITLSTLSLDQLFIVVNTQGKSGITFEADDYEQLECDYTDNVTQAGSVPRLVAIEENTCANSPFEFFGSILNMSGSYHHIIQDRKSCDSVIIKLDLIVKDTIIVSLEEEACSSYAWGGQTYNESGVYTHSETSIYGCDSTITLNLSVHPSYDETIEVSACESYSWNGTIYTSSGIYPYTTMSSEGCDSTITLNLTVDLELESIEVIEQCKSYDWNGTTYTESGYYEKSFVSSQGCDSIAYLDLTIYPVVQVEQTLSVCDSLLWHGDWLKQSGIYSKDTLTNKGCDSTFSLILTVNHSYHEVIHQFACESYTWNGTLYTESGTYPYFTINSTGCDSIITLDLTINDILESTETVEECDHYDWNGTTYTESGHYEKSFTSVHGCDSIAHLDLILLPSILVNTSVEACDSLLWNGMNLTSSGSYNFDDQTIHGCDSTISLDLTVHPSYVNTIDRIACESYNWNGTTYTESGNYTYLTESADGCDSMITLNLSINDKIEIWDEITVCDSIQWHGQVLAESGEYFALASGVDGCDSLYTLNLIVADSYAITDTIETSDTYIWPVNGAGYNRSGVYEERYSSSDNCDSIRYLYLKVEQELKFSFPNILQPGSENGYFLLYPPEIIVDLFIFDRWGNEVYRFDEDNPGWDGTKEGKPVAPGVYIWRAKLRTEDKLITRSGDITVIR